MAALSPGLRRSSSGMGAGRGNWQLGVTAFRSEDPPLRYLQELVARKADAPAVLQRLIDQLSTSAN
ncbi:MAG: hypothetical protein CMP84_00445 [Gammaproteobacteria bacterium]|nr:hypothetical protein [Gammaproteobacteria bacterium]